MLRLWSHHKKQCQPENKPLKQYQLRQTALPCLMMCSANKLLLPADAVVLVSLKLKWTDEICTVLFFFQMAGWTVPAFLCSFLLGVGKGPTVSISVLSICSRSGECTLASLGTPMCDPLVRLPATLTCWQSNPAWYCWAGLAETLLWIKRLFPSNVSTSTSIWGGGKVA